MNHYNISSSKLYDIKVQKWPRVKFFSLTPIMFLVYSDLLKDIEL